MNDGPARGGGVAGPRTRRVMGRAAVWVGLWAAGAAGAEVRPFLERHCGECHSGAKPKGKWGLEQLGDDFADRTVRERWQRVVEQMTTGAMPPEEKPRPSAAEAGEAAEWITGRVAQGLAEQRATVGRVVLRRLNRTEFENTVRDLLAVEVNLKDALPPDSSLTGFDNVGEALHTSSFLIERYLEAAELALDEAMANRPRPKSVTKRVTLADAHQVRSSKEDVFRKGDGGKVTMFSSSNWVAATLFYPEVRGRYRFRLSVTGVQSGGKPVTFGVQVGGGMGGPKAHLIDYFDAPPGVSKVIEFDDLMEPRTSLTIQPYGLAGAQSVSQVGAADWDGPGLQVDWVEMEGPLNPDWPPESHRRLFGDLPLRPAGPRGGGGRLEVFSADPLRDAERLLRPFVGRAYRRAVTDEDVQPLRALVKARLDAGHSFERAMRVGFAAAMTSPDFLFLREKAGPLDDFALASRLSYFLWSSMPDEELMGVAAAGRLREPAVLRAQTERLMRHAKARAFTENFTGQWLALRDIDFTMPGNLLYPEYDDMLRHSMVREAELFFDEVLKGDLSVARFIASDFSMLNGRLARHYGIPGVEGWSFRRVELPPGSHRGGVLTMAAVLKVTANGTTTSPVVRGAWVLDRLLGTPPKPPPEGVSALEPDTRGTITIREKLARHRQIASCATCHVQIDPPGFALESFDVIGGYREHYRTTGMGQPVVVDGQRMHYLQGPAVDPSGALADGRAFGSIDELKQLLLRDVRAVARALTIRLITYATGAAPETADAATIDRLVDGARDLGFRSLVHGVIASDLFQSK